MRELGSDTFRPSTRCVSRDGLYAKNTGEVEWDSNGMVRFTSPLTDKLHIAPSRPCTAVKDPISGATLDLQGGRLRVTTPSYKQTARFAKNLMVNRDVEITLNHLRNTTGVSEFTNEKVGTAGSPTGCDPSFAVVQERYWESS